MSTLNGLLQELKQNGVSFRPLSEVLKIKNGSDYKKYAKGDIPVYGSGGVLSYIDRFAYDQPSVLIPRKGSIDKLYYVDGPFWTVDTIFYTEIDRTILEPKFLYYYLQMKHLERLNTAGGVPTLTQNVLKTIQIPMVPKPLQLKIIQILDEFSQKNTELIAQLTKEYQARKQQYAYFRDQLLTFDDRVAQMTLGEIATFRRGSFPQPYGNSRWYGGRNAMPFVQVADIAESGMRLREQTKHTISELAQPKSVFVPKGTAIVSLQGSIGRVAITQYDSYVDRTIAVFEAYKININKRYFAYQLERKFGLEKECARGSTLKTITKEEFTKFQIPVPPIEIQEHVVSLLDRLTACYNAMFNDLSKETGTRRRQYEYYRDKLLNFKKVTA